MCLTVVLCLGQTEGKLEFLCIFGVREGRWTCTDHSSGVLILHASVKKWWQQRIQSSGLGKLTGIYIDFQVSVRRCFMDLEKRTIEKMKFKKEGVRGDCRGSGWPLSCCQGFHRCPGGNRCIKTLSAKHPIPENPNASPYCKPRPCISPNPKPKNL